MSFRSIFCGALALLSADAHAATGEPLDLQVRFPHYHTTYAIKEDGTATESREWSETVLKPSAIQYVKHASVSYSTSAQTAEIVAAYTKKADGRRIDVPKDNYQIEENRGRGKDSPVYSDYTTMSLIFPDVDVGDTVVLSYKLIWTQALFPGHFAITEHFGDDAAYDDVRLTIDHPKKMWTQSEVHGMKQKKRSAGDRAILELTYSNPKPLKSARINYSVYDPDQGAGFSFSTFRTYRDIAAAYGERALPKAAVNQRIQKLADEIAKDATTPKEQARALYEWVATNITYAGNCIGIGAVVPRDLDFVLDNKIGDCKDHATLLQAMLAAKGIRSTQALINSGSTYKLQKVPVVSMVNHVINYIPSLDLFVDSTSNSTPFGRLPFGDQDKPVLLVDGYQDGTRTPASSPDDATQRTRTVMKVAPDGTASGSVEVFQKGESAAAMRSWISKLTRDVEEDMVKNMFRRQGMIGSGQFVHDDPKGLGDEYRYAMHFTTEKYLKLPGAGAFPVSPPPLGSGGVQPLLQFYGELETTADVTCHSGTAIDEYEIELPAGTQILSLPDEVRVGNDTVRYEAHYAAEGNKITATRKLDDRTRGNVCSPKVTAAYKKVADDVVDDLKSQVLYKLPRAAK